MEDITKKAPKQEFSFNNRTYEASDDIAFFSQELYLLKLENKLLGDYDSTGKYALPKEILKNLTDLKKTLVKKEQDDLYLKAESLNHEFRFVVKFVMPNKTQKVAQLFLIETLTSLMLAGKEISSLVSNYIDDNDAFFEEKYKKVFNIVPDSEDGKKEENETIAKALLEKLKFENKVFVNFLLQSRLKDKIYVEKLLKSLAKDTTGHIVLKKYEALLAKYGESLKPGDKNYYRRLKQILDEVLEEERKTLSNNLNLLIIRLRQSYVKASAPIVESLKTAVVEKQKQIAKEIKIGKGSGSLKFSYYKGISEKKSNSKPKKKHPNLESIKKQKKVGISNEVDASNNLSEGLLNKVSAYITIGKSAVVSKETSVKTSAFADSKNFVENKVETQAKINSHKIDSLNKESYKEQLEKIEQAKIREQNKQNKQKQTQPSKEVKAEKLSMFGRLLGD